MVVRLDYLGLIRFSFRFIALMTVEHYFVYEIKSVRFWSSFVTEKFHLHKIRKALEYSYCN